MITPNRLTYLRIVLSVVVIYLLMTPSLTGRILAFFVFTAASLTDYFDGRMARSRSMVTALGKILDPIADKLLILSTYACFALLGLFSLWWIAPIAIREIGVTLLRFLLLSRGVVVAAERAGKRKVVAQLVSIAFCYAWLMGREYLWPARLPGLEPVVVYGAWLSLLVATAFTLYSGGAFLQANWQQIWRGSAVEAKPL